MIDLLHSRQIGLQNPLIVKNKEVSRRFNKLKLCKNTKLEQSQIGGLNTADIDAVENRYLLVGGSTGGVAIHDLYKRDNLEASTCICRVEGSSRHAHSNSVQTARWYPLDTGMFTTSGTDKILKIWDTNTLVPADSYELNGIIYSHDLSPVATSHSLIAVASQSNRVKLIDLKTGSATQILRGHKDCVLCVRWSLNDDYTLASAGKDKRVLIWDIRRAKGHLCTLGEGTDGQSQSQETTTHKGIVNTLSFTNDGLHLITSGTDNTIRLWDAHRWKHIPTKFHKIKNQTLKNVQLTHSDAKNGLLFIPEEEDIKVYDLLRGRLRDVLSGHFSNVNFLVYRQEYHELYSGAHDKQVLIWESGVRGEVGEKCVGVGKGGVREVREVVNEDEWSDDD